MAKPVETAGNWKRRRRRGGAARMVGITRRTFVGSVAASSMAGAELAPFRARAAEFSYKYANNLPLTHPLNLRAQEAAAKIGAESGGRMEIQIFPNNQLGGD